MVNPGYPGNVDDSDLPILPWWYIPGINAQNVNQLQLPAPANQVTFNQLPSNLTYVQVTGNYDDGSGNWLGGFLTFEQSDDLLLNNGGTYYRIPKRLVGQVPVPNTLAYNWEGSGRVYIQFGTMNVMLLATNTAGITVQVPYYETQEPGFVQPTSWVYHVKEYFMGGYEYDIAPVISQASAPVDINTLIIPSTYVPNTHWSPQWCDQ